MKLIGIGLLLLADFIFAKRKRKSKDSSHKYFSESLDKQRYEPSPRKYSSRTKDY